MSIKLREYTGPKIAQIIDYTIANNGFKIIDGVGERFRVISSDGELQIKSQDSSFAAYGNRQGLDADPDALFERLEIKNLSGGIVTFRLFYGFGDFIDGQSQITGSVAVTSVPPVSLAASVSATAATKAQAPKNVAAAGTPVPLAAVSLLCEKIRIKAMTANTNIIKVGYAAGAGNQLWELVATEWMTLEAPVGKRLDPSTIWIDSVVNGEGVIFETLF